MDGLNFKTTGNILSEFFTQDENGMFIPSDSKLLMGDALKEVRNQLNADTGIWSRLSEIYFRSDVKSTHNPLGNTPVIGAGYRLFGVRPLNGQKLESILQTTVNAEVENKLQKRQNKLVAYQEELYNLYISCSSLAKDPQSTLLYKIEGDQILTGGGFDGNKVGDVHVAGMHFLNSTTAEMRQRLAKHSKMIVDACLRLRDSLEGMGVGKGSINPYGASKVRFEQNSDGMLGWPVYATGNDELSPGVSQRLLIGYGVNTSDLVGSHVRDKNSGVDYKYRVIDAIAHILDNKIFSARDLVSIVTLLVRIQKHGWEKKDKTFVAKKGKTRAIYPNSAVPALIEGMIVAPFIDKLKDIKCPLYTSLQDKPTRVNIIKNQVLKAANLGYDYLAADWSKYDATIQGSVLATWMQLVLKYFVNSKHHHWVDAATYILTYKYIILDTNLARINNAEFSATLAARPNASVKNYTLVGTTDGLISGAKATMIGGSSYGDIIIHDCIPRLMGFNPLPGQQAGDDTLMAIPTDRINYNSAIETYKPVKEAAAEFGLIMNEAKQTWHVSDGELLKVFLQENYHSKTNTWGIGSAFRYPSSLFPAERDRFDLKLAGQMMQEIGRMNNGHDSPFITPVVEFWLSKEQWLGNLFKTHGIAAWDILKSSIEKDSLSLEKALTAGEYNWSLRNVVDLNPNTVPIIKTMVDVSKSMNFTSVKMPPLPTSAKDDLSEAEDDMDLLEDDEV